MDKVVDFSDCKRVHATFGGTDRKFGVVYQDHIYMLKFSERHAKKHDISTSYVNNVISEYISSHIANSMGLPVHETVLGLYKDELVVGCRDFREHNGVSNVEFSEYVRAKYDSKDVKRVIKLQQIYDTLRDPENDISAELQKASIERYWDTFVADAFVGNFDRHIGNWGYLAENNVLRLAPLYDFGSTLYPQMSDVGAIEFRNDVEQMMKRCLVFPSPSLVITDEKVGKVGYYDMLASNYDVNCTQAVLRMVPQIDMDKVREIIDNTPLITQERKDFYKDILQIRKEVILDRAYLRCFEQDFDKEALQRLTTGHQFSENDLSVFLRNRQAEFARFQHNHMQLEASKARGYARRAFLERTMPVINRESIFAEQKHLMKTWGFSDPIVWDVLRAQQKTRDISNRESSDLSQVENPVI